LEWSRKANKGEKDLQSWFLRGISTCTVERVHELWLASAVRLWRQRSKLLNQSNEKTIEKCEREKWL
jgi:hypothetical protein